MRKHLCLAVAVVVVGSLLLGAEGASATRLCSAKPEEKGGVLSCPMANRYGTEIKPEQTLSATQATNVTFESIEGPTGTVTCKASTFVAALKSDGTSEAGNGITSWSFEGGKECASTVTGTTGAAITVENLSYDATKAIYEGLGAPQGRLMVAKASGALQIKMVFNAKFTCIYQLPGIGSELNGDYENSKEGNPSKLKFTSQKFKLTTGGMSCPMTIRLTGTYNIKGFGNIDVYIAKE